MPASITTKMRNHRASFIRLELTRTGLFTELLLFAELRFGFALLDLAFLPDTDFFRDFANGCHSRYPGVAHRLSIWIVQRGDNDILTIQCQTGIGWFRRMTWRKILNKDYK